MGLRQLHLSHQEKSFDLSTLFQLESYLPKETYGARRAKENREDKLTITPM